MVYFLSLLPILILIILSLTRGVKQAVLIGFAFKGIDGIEKTIDSQIFLKCLVLSDQYKKGQPYSELHNLTNYQLVLKQKKRPDVKIRSFSK